MIEITVAGNLGNKDAQPIGDKGARFSIAGSYYDREAQERRTKWFDVSVWGRDAEYALRAKSGDFAVVTGTLSFREYNGKEYAQIRANQIKLAGGTTGSARGGGQRRLGQQRQQGRGGYDPGGADIPDNFGDDDIPF